MRKVLLATTALVATAGVASAEVSINGFYEFNYISVSDDNTANYDQFSDDTEVHIKFSATTDNGLTFGMVTELEGAEGGGADEGSMYVSGDFGKVTLGENDGAYGNLIYFGNTHSAGAYGSSVPTVNKSNAALKVMNPNAIDTGSDTNKIVYSSPSMGGFSFQYGYEEATSVSSEPNTSASIGYSQDLGVASLTLGAGMFDSGESTDAGDGTSVGMQISSGDATISVVQGGTKTSTTHDMTGTAFGVDYAVSDSLTVSAEYWESSNDIAAEKDSVEATGFGVSYVIASGLKLDLMSHTYDLIDGAASAQNNSGSVVRASITASF